MRYKFTGRIVPQTNLEKWEKIGFCLEKYTDPCPLKLIWKNGKRYDLLTDLHWCVQTNLEKCENIGLLGTKFTERTNLQHSI